MKTMYDRTSMLIGSEKMENLCGRRVIVFGAGGVGGFVLEALARTGIGTLAVVDFDTIDVTNINRQIIALHSTVGLAKTDVMAERIRDINPKADVRSFRQRLSEENIDEFHVDKYDYIVDAIDDVKAKLLLISRAKQQAIPIISSMGTGNKRNPSLFEITDIKKTHTCPLARVIRREAAKMGIDSLKVLYSKEEPRREEYGETSRAPASISFVPAAAGLLIASEVVWDLLH